jgi:hypothetical protein
VRRLAYNGDVAAGQLAVFRGASEVLPSRFRKGVTLDLITREIESEEDLPEERIVDRAGVSPDAAIAGQEMVE